MKKVLQISAGLALSIFFIWLGTRGQSLAELVEAFKQAKVSWLLAYYLLLGFLHLVRTLRWGLLLRPLGRIEFRELNAIAGVGFMALILMPLRLGEFARPVLAAERMQIRMSGALASVVVERVVDGLLIALLLVATLWTVGLQLDSPHLGQLRLAALLLSGVFALGIVVLIFAVRNQAKATLFLYTSVGRLSPRLAHRLSEMMNAFVEGLKAASSTGSLLNFLGLSVLYWFLTGIGLILAARAFDIPLGVLPAMTILALQVVGVMIPAGPGMVGTFHFFTALGLSLFLTEGYAKALPTAYSHAVWLVQFSQHMTFGLYFLATGRVSLRSLVKLREKNEGIELSP